MPTINENEDDGMGNTAHQVDAGGAPLPFAPQADADDPPVPPPPHDPPSDQADTGDMDVGYGSNEDDDEVMQYAPSHGFHGKQMGGAPQSLCSAGSFGLYGPGPSAGGMGPSGSGGPPNVFDPATSGAAKLWMGGSCGSEVPCLEAPKDWLGGTEVASQVAASLAADVGNIASLAGVPLPPTPPPPPANFAWGGGAPPPRMPTAPWGKGKGKGKGWGIDRDARRRLRLTQHKAAMLSSPQGAWQSPAHLAALGPVQMGNACPGCSGHNQFSLNCSNVSGKFCGPCCRWYGGCDAHP